MRKYQIIVMISLPGLLLRSFFFINLCIFLSFSVFALPIDNVVSLYRLDGDTNDELGLNNLTNVGATVDTNCHLGSCYKFDGVDDYMFKTSFSNFPSSTENKSMSFWVRLDTPTTYNIIWNYASTGLNRLELRYRNSINKYEFVHRTATAVDRIAVANAATNQNEWHHIVWTYNNPTTKLYIDGVLQTDTDTTAHSYSGTTFSLGDWGEAGGGYFNGSIDEVSLWNITLTDAQVLDIYENGTGVSNPLVAPSITDIRYNLSDGSPAEILSSIQQNSILSAINASVVIDSRDYYALANVSLRYPNGTYVYQNQPMSNITNNYFYDSDVTLDKVGIWTIDINVTSYGENGTQVTYATDTFSVVAESFVISLNNVISAYHLDGNGDDAHGSNDLTNYGATTNSSCLTVGGCMKFDGIDDYMYISSFTGFPGPTSAKSMSFWIRLDAPTTYNVIWNYASTNLNRLELNYRLANNYYTFTHRTGIASDKIARANAATNQGEWHHVVWTYDNPTTRLYIDGVLQTDTDSSTHSYSGTAFSLGDWLNGQGGYFNGTLDEVIIFNKTLNQTEINYLNNSGVPRIHPFTDGGNGSIPTVPPPVIGTIHYNLSDGTKDTEITNVSLYSIIDTIYTNITFNETHNFMNVNITIQYPNGTTLVNRQPMTNTSIKYTYDWNYNVTTPGEYTIIVNATSYDVNLSSASTQQQTTFLVDSGYSLTIEDLYENATTFDNILIVYDIFLYTNTSNIPKPLIIYTPGWSGTRANVRSNGEPQYVAREHVVANMDTRGRGDSGGSRDVYGYSCADALAVAQQIRQKQYGQYISNVTYLFGGSDGGGYAVTCMLKTPDLYSGAGILAGISNTTFFYYGLASATHISNMQSWIGGTPATNREGYDSRTASYLAENVVAPFYMYHGTADASVGVGQSNQFNTTLRNMSFDNFIYDRDGGTHSESANYTKYDIAYAFLNETVYNIPTSGNMTIGSFLHTKNFSIYFSDMDDIGFINYSIVNRSNNIINIRSRSFSGNVNMSLYNLLPSTEYTLYVDSIETNSYNTTSDGTINWLQSIGTTEKELVMTISNTTLAPAIPQNVTQIENLTNVSNTNTSIYIIWNYTAISNASIYLDGSYYENVSYPINFLNLSPLSPNTTYTITAYAFNATTINLSISIENNISANTRESPPPLPSGDTQIENLTYYARTNQSISIVWNYTVFSNASIYVDAVNIINITYPTNTYVISGLLPSTVYNITLYAYNNSFFDFNISSENNIFVSTLANPSNASCSGIYSVDIQQNYAGNNLDNITIFSSIYCDNLFFDANTANITIFNNTGNIVVNNATMIKQDNQTGLFRYFFIPETSGNYYIKVQYYNTSALLIERGQSIHIETSDEEKMFGLTIIIALIGIGMLFIYGSSHLKVDEVPTRRVPEKMLLYGLYLATVVSVAGALLVYVNNQAFASYFSVPANTIFIVVIGGVFAILCFYLIYVLEVMFRNKEQREDMDD